MSALLLLLLFLVVDFVLCEIVGPPFFHTHWAFAMLLKHAAIFFLFAFAAFVVVFRCFLFAALLFVFVLKSANSLQTITLRMVLMDSAIGTIFIVSSFCPQSYPPIQK